MDQELRVAKLTHRDDIEVYLTTFERLIINVGVQRPEGSANLQTGASAVRSGTAGLCGADCGGGSELQRGKSSDT